MIKLLSTPLYNNEHVLLGKMPLKGGVFQPLGKLALIRRGALTEKIERLQTRMSEWDKKSKTIKYEQVNVCQTAVLMQQNQVKIVRRQRSLKKEQREFDQDITRIKQNHLHMLQIDIFLTQIWNTLFQYAFNIQSNQDKLQVQLNRIEQKQQSIHQHATLIHHNVPLIKGNLQHARLKVDKIDHTASMIQVSDQIIAAQVKEIEEKGDYIRQHIPRLYSGQKEDVHSEASRPFAKDKKSFQLNSSFPWLKKMYDFCLRTIMAVCDQIERGNQYLQIKSVSADFSITHPSISSLISWMAMSILASTGMLEVKFSWNQFTLHGSFIELKRRSSLDN